MLNVPPGAQLGLHFMLAPSCFERALRLGKGDAFVLHWVVNHHLRFNPPSSFFLEGAWLLVTRNRCLSSRDRLANKWSLTRRQVDKALNAKLGLLSSHIPQATRKPCLNSHNRVHGHNVVSVEGGDCSKRSNFEGTCLSLGRKGKPKGNESYFGEEVPQRKTDPFVIAYQRYHVYIVYMP